MNKLEKRFEQDLINSFKATTWREGIYDYVEGFTEEDLTNKRAFLEFWEEMQDLEEVGYDSYGNENSVIGFIFKDKISDRYIEVWGRRQSYNGEEWKSIKEVKPTQVTTTVYVP